MKEHKLRFMSKDDQPRFLEFFNATPENLCDPDILSYPSLRVLCAYDDQSGAEAFLPQQDVTMLESLAVKPGLSPLDAAKAFKDLVKASEVVASSKGHKEMYFVCKDENVIGMAKRHGFEELPWKVCRMKLT